MKPLRSRISGGLSRTRALLLADVGDLLRGGTRPSPEALDLFEERLLEADLGPEAAADVRLRLEEAKMGLAPPTPEEVLALVADVLRGKLEPHAAPRRFDARLSGPPHVILVVGVNGTGKTTTIGKMAHAYGQAGRRVLLAAADTYRAAAADQLAIWAERSGSLMVGSQEGADPAAVAWDALEAAISRGVDVLIVDTAGRLHTRKGLMDELAKIRRVLGKRLEGAPHETVLVLDATTGQNAIVQAETFRSAVEVTGLVLTKLDGTARGGVIVPIADRLGIPVEMIGVGEGIEDLRPFNADEFASALLEVENE
ncbi:signal recognition particle-docking protein FtsY [Gemmatimonadota bacterium]